MDKILFNHMDVNVAGTYVYANDGIAYKDSECTEAFNTEVLKNVFLKGAVIVVSEAMYKPIAFALNDNDVGVLTYVTADTTTATTAVLAIVTAVEEVEEESEAGEESTEAGEESTEAEG